MNNPTIADELGPLSNEEIELLGEIVFAAEKLPNARETPFRALFAAYDQVLEQYDIDKENDKVFLRFLLRMAEDRSKDVTLFEKFRDLLWRMGIEVERAADGDGDGVHSDQFAIDDRLAEEEENATRTRSIGTKTRERRASSFDPMLSRISEMDTAKSMEAEDATTHHERQRRQSAGAAANDFSPSRVRKPPPHSAAQPTQRGRVSNRHISEQIPIRLRRNRSTSSHGSLRITRRPSVASVPYEEYTADASDVPSIDDDADGNFVIPHAHLRRTPREMEEFADAFEHQHQIRLARGLLHQWSQVTRDARQQHRDLDAIAVAHDRRMLLKSGFETLRAAYENRKRYRETERFFNHLENRASKARDLFLLTKAFTHWAQCASEEVMRTSVARRHILRTRYFNAWREITAVNEMKTRRFILRKFMGKWRQRTSNLVDDHITAVTTYERNLASRIYWQWFWKFCERRAPLWGHRKTKANFFKIWKDSALLLKERENSVAQMRAHDTQRKVFTKWSEKLRKVQDATLVAENHRRTNLLGKAFFALKQQASLRSHGAQGTQSHDERIARTALAVWRHRAVNTRRAVQWYRENTARKAFRAWRESFASKLLTARIDERILIETLYKWTLKSRLELYRRIHERSAKRNALGQWLAKTHIHHNRFEAPWETFQARQRGLRLKSCFQAWRSKLEAIREHEQHASYQYGSRLLYGTTGTWLTKHQHLQDLQQMSADANFYVAGKHVLAKWKDATKRSQRHRRRQIYIQFRTQKKMNLARRVLLTWRDAANGAIIMERQANEVQENRLLRNTQTILRSWQQKAQHTKALEAQAVQRHQKRLRSWAFNSWTKRHDVIQAMNAQVEPLVASVLENSASSCFKKLNWQLFQIQRKEENAVALQRRNFDKHVRSMLRYWSEQVAERRAIRTRETMDVSPSPRLGPIQPGELENHVADIDEDNLFDEEGVRRSAYKPGLDESDANLGQSFFSLHFPTEPSGMDGMITSTPGYLRTPSKRLSTRKRLLGLSVTAAPSSASAGPGGRGKTPATAPVAQIVESTTPAGLPGITSFERKLRQQGYSERKPSRLQPSPSRFGVSSRTGARFDISGFEDIREESGEGSSHLGRPRK